MLAFAPRSLPRRIILPLLALTGLFSSPGSAQELMPRLHAWRAKRAANTPASDAAFGRSRPMRPVWVVLAQLEPPANPSAASSTSPTGDREVQPAGTPESGRRRVTTYADLSFGFDGQTIVVADPTPREARIRRRIRVLNVSAEYPLGPRTNLAVGVPLVGQSVQFRGVSNTTLRGNGIGDVSVVVQRRSPESKRGVETGIALGLVLPTGKDTFELRPNELPTGNGFYQPFVRLSLRKLRVPLQLFGSVNYGQGLSRTVNGERFRLPASYGGEIGFSYALGPEFSVSTSLNANRLSSPFLLDAGQNVAYLSQSLSYNSGGDTSFRANADLGLTDDSTDAFVGVSLRRTF